MPVFCVAAIEYGRDRRIILPQTHIDIIYVNLWQDIPFFIPLNERI
jgi:hypothetical protein